MPTPLGPVIKAWQAPAAVTGVPHHLPGVVDARGVTGTSTQRPEIGHAHAIGAGDKGMLSTCGRGGPPHHLPGVVDARGVTVTSTQRPEIGQSFAIGVYDVCMVTCAETGETKPSPILRAAARIKLWILELWVIFMIFSPVREGF